jgi:hypothetical protein
MSAHLHYIQLRGPWEIEPVLRARLQGDGQVAWSDDVPARFTAKLPVDPAAVLGEFRGRVRYRRRFNQPTNLSPAEKVFLSFAACRAEGIVSVNNIEVGRFAAADTTSCFDVTAALRLANVLCVELTSVAADAAPGIAGAVTLEIRG